MNRSAYSVLLLLAGCAPSPDSKRSDDTAPDTDTDTDTTPSGNQAPSAPVVAVTPVHPTDEEDLSVTLVTPATDPEGSPVTYTYGWSVDGNLRADLVGEVVAASETSDGQVWAVSVTPSDGEVAGTPGTASVTIGNSAPSAVGFHLEPAAPAGHEAISVVVDEPAVDPDGDKVTTTIQWYENGFYYAGRDNQTELAGSYVDGGDVFQVVISASDGKNPPVVSEASVEVANQPPDVQSVLIGPGYPGDDDDLTATVRAEDPDSSTALSLRYVWYRDGVEATDVGNVDVVPADATALEEQWSVTVYASDGIAEGNGSPLEPTVIIPWWGSIRSQRLSGTIASDGSVNGTWAVDLLSYGPTAGNNSCSVEWEVTGANNPSLCPSCEYYLTTDQTVTSSSVDFGCATGIEDATGIIAIGGGFSFFFATSYGTYLGAYTMYFRLLETESYSYSSYSGTLIINRYGFEFGEDTAGNLEFSGYWDWTRNYPA